jgi:hypothetical protein
MTRYRAIRVQTMGDAAISDDEARAMFGLPPREEPEEDAAAAARELLGGVGLQAVPDASGDGEGAEEAEEAPSRRVRLNERITRAPGDRGPRLLSCC